MFVLLFFSLFFSRFSVCFVFLLFGVGFHFLVNFLFLLLVFSFFLCYLFAFFWFVLFVFVSSFRMCVFFLLSLQVFSFFVGGVLHFSRRAVHGDANFMKKIRQNIVNYDVLWLQRV